MDFYSLHSHEAVSDLAKHKNPTLQEIARQVLPGIKVLWYMSKWRYDHSMPGGCGDGWYGSHVVDVPRYCTSRRQTNFILTKSSEVSLTILQSLSLSLSLSRTLFLLCRNSLFAFLMCAFGSFLWREMFCFRLSCLLSLSFNPNMSPLSF